MSRYSLFVSLIAVFGLGLALSPTTKGQARLPHTFTSTVTVSQTATQTGVHAGALASTSTGVRIGGLDHNIQDLRNNAVPNFHYKYDDYLQYAPAALMLGLKAFGVESETAWGPMLVADACSAGIMALAVNGIKYSVGRLRPDGSRHNSFPSGHTATAFLTATLLHKEYGSQSPWYSIGAYSAAAITGVSRILNNRHWITDVVAGAAIGIGSVHLGYYLSDLIFQKDEDSSGFEYLETDDHAPLKHVEANLLFGQKFQLRQQQPNQPSSAALAALAADICLHPDFGLSARIATSTTTNPSNTPPIATYTGLAGGFYKFHLAKRWELQPYLMAGYAWNPGNIQQGPDLTAGISLHLLSGEHFKLKIFAELESIHTSKGPAWIHFGTLGWSTSWFLSWGS